MQILYHSFSQSLRRWSEDEQTYLLKRALRLAGHHNVRSIVYTLDEIVLVLKLGELRRDGTEDNRLVHGKALQRLERARTRGIILEVVAATTLARTPADEGLEADDTGRSMAHTGQGRIVSERVHVRGDDEEMVKDDALGMGDGKINARQGRGRGVIAAGGRRKRWRRLFSIT